MNVITVPTKDVGDVKDCFKRGLGYKKTDEDMIEDSIKKELGIRE